MEGTLYSVVYITTFITGFVSAIIMIVFFFKMILGIKEDKKLVANIIAPLVLISPGILTKKGRKSRLLFFLFLLVLVGCISSLVYFQLNFGKPPYMQ